MRKSKWLSAIAISVMCLVLFAACGSNEHIHSGSCGHEYCEQHSRWDCGESHDEDTGDGNNNIEPDNEESGNNEDDNSNNDDDNINQVFDCNECKDAGCMICKFTTTLQVEHNGETLIYGFVIENYTEYIVKIINGELSRTLVTAELRTFLDDFKILGDDYLQNNYDANASAIFFPNLKKDATFRGIIIPLFVCDQSLTIDLMITRQDSSGAVQSNFVQFIFDDWPFIKSYTGTQTFLELLEKIFIKDIFKGSTITYNDLRGDGYIDTFAFEIKL